MLFKVFLIAALYAFAFAPPIQQGCGCCQCCCSQAPQEDPTTTTTTATAQKQSSCDCSSVQNDQAMATNTTSPSKEGGSNSSQIAQQEPEKVAALSPVAGSSCCNCCPPPVQQEPPTTPAPEPCNCCCEQPQQEPPTTPPPEPCNCCCCEQPQPEPTTTPAPDPCDCCCEQPQQEPPTTPAPEPCCCCCEQPQQEPPTTPAPEPCHCCCEQPRQEPPTLATGQETTKAQSEYVAPFLNGYFRAKMFGPKIFKCPEGYKRIYGSCYHIETEKMSFHQAAANCKELGGSMFVPKDITEWHDVMANAPPNFWTWTGIVHNAKFPMPLEWDGMVHSMNVSNLEWLVKPFVPLLNGWTFLSECAAFYNTGTEKHNYVYFYPCLSNFHSICEAKSSF